MKSNRWGEDIICDTLQSNVILEILTAGITNPNPKYKMLQNISSSDLDYDCYNFEYVLSKHQSKHIPFTPEIFIF